MNVNQCETVIAEDVAVAFDAVGEIPKHHTVHFALVGIKVVDVSGCEEERCTALKSARDIRNCLNRVLGIEMKHDAPRNRSVEHSIGEWGGLNDSFDHKSFGAVLLELGKHRTRTI